MDDTFNQLSTEVKELNAVVVFFMPNPAHDRVTMGGVPSGTDISIYNAHGQRMPQVLSAGMMDVSTWPNGVYHLRARTGSMVSTARLVVDH
ncbi:MAG: T9SS type A sorting domain-containing protein [Flavobacteriales bacterium]|nr:T9SS type A sorting domain-containing protein [Flavobacteriales bacterium]